MCEVSVTWTPPVPSPDTYSVHHVVFVGGLIAHSSTPLNKIRCVWWGMTGGAYVAWHLCQFIGDRVKSLVALSVQFIPRDPAMKPVCDSISLRNWELTAPWTGTQVKVPVKFIVGDLNLTYNTMGTKEYIDSGRFKKDVPFLEEVVVMEGVGHFITEERPDKITAYIFEFIQKH